MPKLQAPIRKQKVNLIINLSKSISQTKFDMKIWGISIFCHIYFNHFFCCTVIKAFSLVPFYR